jgi:hypothetical protein
MKYTATLFSKDSELAKAYKDKTKDMQTSDTVGKPYEGMINGKLVKMVLMDGVKAQYRALLEAEDLLNTNIFTKVDDAFSLRMRIWNYAKQNMLIDGKEGCKMLDDEFEIDFIEQAIILYCTELLFPLFHRSCTRVEEVLKLNLTKYMPESAKD